MGARKELTYSPDYAVPPGDTLLETIQTLGMDQAELAMRTGRTHKHINEIIKGKAVITPETALQLERATGVPAGFWNNLERNYQEAKVRREETERLHDKVRWLDTIPVRAMIRSRWIRPFTDKVQQVQELLNFFGVASPEQWHELWDARCVSYRKSPAFQVDSGAMAAWLRKGEVEAQRINCRPYDENAFKEALGRIRALTSQPPDVFCSEIERICAAAGVAVAFVPELPRTRVWGATRWLSPSKALIQLSLRYKTDDHLWFTFFHEAGHIIQHGKRDVFIEVDRSIDIKEQEADRFSRDMLIPPSVLLRFIRSGKSNREDEIRRFAEMIGIAPGIVVGRLQHDKLLPQSFFNGLKRRFAWVGVEC